MLEEFEEAVPMRQPTETLPTGRDAARQRTAFARLVARVYRSASAPLRADMLAVLLRPLGTLSVVAVASGAFAQLLQHGGTLPSRLSPEDAERFSPEQVRELATFAYEVNPAALLHIGSLLSQNAMAVTALSASALMVLYRRWRAGRVPL